MSNPRLLGIQPTRDTVVMFVCDIQPGFSKVISNFEAVVVNTAVKMTKIAKILSIPVVATEQRPDVFGNTVEAINLNDLGPLLHGCFPKTKFGMVLPEVERYLKGDPEDENPHYRTHIILFGMEAHICVAQTALDLIHRGYTVWVLADGVSSCNKEEVPIALDLMRQCGARITTSEGIIFQLMGDAKDPLFKQCSAVIKAEKENTKNALAVLSSRL